MFYTTQDLVLDTLDTMYKLDILPKRVIASDLHSDCPCDGPCNLDKYRQQALKQQRWTKRLKRWLFGERP